MEKKVYLTPELDVIELSEIESISIGGGGAAIDIKRVAVMRKVIPSIESPSE